MSRTEDLYYSPEAAARSKIFEAQVRRNSLNQIPFGRAAVNARAFGQLAAAKDMVMTPLFGAYLDRISQAVHNPEPGLAPREYLQIISDRIDYIGNYALTAALAGGEDTKVYVHANDSRIMLPEHGQAILTGADNNLVRVEVSNGDIILTSHTADKTMYIEGGAFDVPRPKLAAAPLCPHGRPHSSRQRHRSQPRYF